VKAWFDLDEPSVYCAYAPPVEFAQLGAFGIGKEASYPGRRVL